MQIRKDDELLSWIFWIVDVFCLQVKPNSNSNSSLSSLSLFYVFSLSQCCLCFWFILKKNTHTPFSVHGFGFVCWYLFGINYMQKMTTSYIHASKSETLLSPFFLSRKTYWNKIYIRGGTGINESWSLIWYHTLDYTVNLCGENFNRFKSDV
jgi:hypothetical protein